MRPFVSPLLRRFSVSFVFPTVAALSGLVLSGCQTISDSYRDPGIPPSSEILRIGVTPNMPPFAFEKNGELVGLEIDFGKALASELGREARFIRMDWDELIPSLQNNRIDILMSGMNYTQERAAILSLTDPYLRSGQRALVLRKNESEYTFPGLIAKTKARVGTEKGTTGEFLVEARFPDARLKTYSSADRGARAVAAGEIELFIHDAPTVLWMAGAYQNKGVTVALPVLSEDWMVWAIARRNQSLLEITNSVIADWQKDGTMAGILSRWISL